MISDAKPGFTWTKSFPKSKRAEVHFLPESEFLLVNLYQTFEMYENIHLSDMKIPSEINGLHQLFNETELGVKNQGS